MQESRESPKIDVEVETFDIAGPLLLRPRRFDDERGFVSEAYSLRKWVGLIGKHTFVQDNHTLSTSTGVVRGLHFQIPPAVQGKLVRVVRGSIYDVAVDIRAGSPTYGRHVGVKLDAAEGTQLWVPAGFAHGFCTLEPQTEVTYKLTDYYSPQHDRGLAWNDPLLAIAWPVVGEPVLSARDRELPSLADLPSYFSWAPPAG